MTLASAELVNPRRTIAKRIGNSLAPLARAYRKVGWNCGETGGISDEVLVSDPGKAPKRVLERFCERHWMAGRLSAAGFAQ